MLILTCKNASAAVQASGGNQDVWHHPDVQFLGLITHQQAQPEC
jgi:hypothetical protein